MVHHSPPLDEMKSITYRLSYRQTAASSRYCQQESMGLMITIAISSVTVMSFSWSKFVVYASLFLEKVEKWRRTGNCKEALHLGKATVLLKKKPFSRQIRRTS
ncbi:uncharacterized protein SPPG_09127 [Spizellomyces punctatus DAOM BR117]|uniref:Uncharacterized protein n=1 Tax=Spizellomyces punctatus (strain DAOM BR117) TaxID=645134 RepID=A0A0L0HL69_SPIPD|nr:uncharacterized protein SPPG_09127 [Spizellomyces punctatus DAOM BR117]KND01872.1 hypothetical protein SPPG_09127 [Spizellomyces punctatus DAOM BR117]|eukprot:XP_016609911.1 hypothetical protein SPPG_09127 [Spizellomyces punctatus DAOM BR117]